MSSDAPVICAFEDTPASRHGLDAAGWLAGALGARLVIAHAFDPMGMPVPSQRAMREDSVDDRALERVARVRAARLLEGAARSVSGAKAAIELVEGPPVRALLGLAADAAARLVVTGTAGRTGLDRVLIGSVASELAARTPCPVAAVTRGAALDEPGPVLAAYDGSEHSLRAARHAAGLAAHLGRELVLLHVANDDERVRVDSGLAEELYAAAVRGLGGDATRPALDLKVSVAVEAGDPVEVVSAVARERSAVMIVAGSRGRGAIASAVLGSVSTGVVRLAGRPVVVVPTSAG